MSAISLRTVTVGEPPADDGPVANSTITVRLIHLASGQTAFETFWSGPIAQNLAAIAQVLRQAADQVDAQRSPIILPGAPR